MGGDDSYDNLVILTAREHFLAHWLLWKIHNHRGCAGAFFAMCMVNRFHNRKKLSQREYSAAREANAFSMRGENHPNWNKPGHTKGMKLSQSHKDKLAVLRLGKKQSEYTVEKRRMSLLGKKTYQPLHDENTKGKISNSLKKNIVLLNDNLQCFDSLSDSDKQILKWYISGLSAPEITRLVNVNVQKVRRLVFMTKNKILKHDIRSKE